MCPSPHPSVAMGLRGPSVQWPIVVTPLHTSRRAACCSRRYGIGGHAPLHKVQHFLCPFLQTDRWWKQFQASMAAPGPRLPRPATAPAAPAVVCKRRLRSGTPRWPPSTLGCGPTSPPMTAPPWGPPRGSCTGTSASTTSSSTPLRWVPGMQHHSTVLHCTVLYCTALYCTLLYVLYCTVL